MPTETSLMCLIVPIDHSQHDQGSQEENLLQWNRGIVFTTRDNLSEPIPFCNFQREKKDESPKYTAIVHTKTRTWSNPNVHFSWSLARVLRPPEIAFSPTW